MSRDKQSSFSSRCEHENRAGDPIGWILCQEVIYEGIFTPFFLFSSEKEALAALSKCDDDWTIKPAYRFVEVSE